VLTLTSRGYTDGGSGAIDGDCVAEAVGGVLLCFGEPLVAAALLFKGLGTVDVGAVLWLVIEVA